MWKLFNFCTMLLYYKFSIARTAIKYTKNKTYVTRESNGHLCLVSARVNNIYIEESILLPYTSVETRSVK